MLSLKTKGRRRPRMRSVSELAPRVPGNEPGAIPRFRDKSAETLKSSSYGVILGKTAMRLTSDNLLLASHRVVATHHRV